MSLAAFTQSMNVFFARLGDPLGIPVDYCKLLFLLFAAIPLSYPLPHLQATVRHLYSLITSFVFLYIVLELHYGFLQLFVMSLSTFGLCAMGKNGYLDKRISFPWPWLVFAACMGQLTIIHTHRYIADTSLEEIEISGPMMVLVQRLTLFAWNAYDLHHDFHLQLLPFLGYAFFLPCFLIGPGIHYQSYVQNLSKPIPRGRFNEAGKRLLVGLVFLGIYATQAGTYSYEKIPQGRAGNSLISKMIFVNLAGFIARTKYYGIWCISEVACIVSGVAQSNQPGEGLWEGARNVRIRNIELAPNWKILLDSWNCFTNVWLRETVYKRLAKKGSKPGFKSTMITFITSAFWHGVNVNYYLSFLLGGFLQSLARNMRKFVRPLFLNTEQLEPKSTAPTTLLKIVYDFLGIVCTQMTVNYAVVPFILLDLRPVLKAWRELAFYGHILTFVPLIFFMLGGKGLLKSLHQQRDPQHEKHRKEITRELRAEQPSLVGHPNALDEQIKEMKEDLQKRKQK